jgi:hypothetical protein
MDIHADRLHRSEYENVLLRNYKMWGEIPQWRMGCEIKGFRTHKVTADHSVVIKINSNKKRSTYQYDLPQTFFSAYVQKSLWSYILSCRKVIADLTQILRAHFSSVIMSTL